MPVKNEDRERFAELISMLAVAFNREADKPLFGAFEMALDDLSIELIGRAVRRAIRECKFMPSGRELRDLAGVAPPLPAPTVADKALIGYQAAAQAVRVQGAYRSVDFADPLVNAAIQSMGGWERFCEWPVDEVQWRQRDFLATYNALSAARASGEVAKALRGICDRENGIEDFTGSVEEQKQIGVLGHVPVPLPAPEPKRITHAATALAHAIGSPSEETEPATEAPEMSADEFDRHKATQLARIRHFKEVLS